MIGLFFKAFLLYLLFLTIRTLYRAYRTVQILKKQGRTATKEESRPDDIEAEYRVLDEKDR